MGDAAGRTWGLAAGWGPAGSGALHLAARSLTGSGSAGLGLEGANEGMVPGRQSVFSQPQGLGSDRVSGALPLPRCAVSSKLP